MKERFFNKAYCHFCNENTQIELREELQKNEIKGHIVTTLVTNAYCVQCGNEVYIPQINDENIDKIDKQYRKEIGIILVSEIEELLEKYDIGTKPLSNLLGWGECTILRYLKGQIPNKEHSDKLKSIKNPYNFLEIYKKNKEVLTDVARKKIEKALANYIEMSSDESNLIPEKGLVEFFSKYPLNEYNGFTKFNIKKLINSILFFANKYSKIYKTKMNKLLWYSDMLCFKRTSQSITGLCYVHDKFGPVPLRYDWIFGSLSDIYIKLEDNDYGTMILPNKDYDESCFSKEELEVLDYIAKKFYHWFCSELTDYSHIEKGYLETYHKELISYKFAKDLKLE